MIDQELCEFLTRRKIPFVLIGAVALAIHGVARFTADVDLLTTDQSVLERGFWASYQGPVPESRTGGGEDPLLGVVRFATMPQHDLIVAQSPGARLALDEAVSLEGLPCLVASPLALLALKAEAGAPQDAYDSRALLEAKALLGDASLAPAFRNLLPSLGKDASRFVDRFRILEGFA
jgi:hypothetical protein